MNFQRYLPLLAILLAITGCNEPQVKPPPPPPSAQDYYQQGIDAESLGNYSIAANNLETAVAMQPDFGIAYCALGRVRKELKHTRQAIDAYLLCVNLLPTDVQGRGELGIVYVTAGQPDFASVHLQRAVDLGTTNALVYYYLAEIHREQRQCQTTIDLYQHTLQLSPNFALAEQGLQLTRRHNCKRKVKTELNMDFFKRGEAQDALIRGRQ
jgi:tetratricopeptide (TPR) repeat protein